MLVWPVMELNGECFWGQKYVNNYKADRMQTFTSSIFRLI